VEFACGAGQINLKRAQHPGLVYDPTELDCIKFLCSQGNTTELLQIITGWNSSCSSQSNEGRGLSDHLNYPSFGFIIHVSWAAAIVSRQSEKGSIDKFILCGSLVWDDGNFQVRSPIVVHVVF
ncbi:hypothetical protein DVH24_023030, partial [Malus domestica]